MANMRLLLLASFVLLLSVDVKIIFADDVIMQPRMYNEALEEFQEPRRKKPFCNAFTGCGRGGRKRSQDPLLSALLDVNSEPAVQDLSRQILSEAKLWQVIQDIRRELQRKQTQQEQVDLLKQFSGRMPNINYRKKRCDINNDC